jgi:hypothetical protein
MELAEEAEEELDATLVVPEFFCLFFAAALVCLELSALDEELSLMINSKVTQRQIKYIE